MKNPLRKRVLRELVGEWHKYAVVAVFLILTVGFVSGMYVANLSMLESAAEHKQNDKLEYGHFVLKDEMSDDFFDDVESGEQADLKTWLTEMGLYEAYKDDLPDPVDPVPITLYEQFYRDVEEDNDCDGEKDGKVRVYAMQTEVNQCSVLSGALPQNDGEIAIDRMHADNNKIKVGDVIRVAGKDYTVSGLVALVNYSTLYEKNSDTMFDALTFDVALVTQSAFDKMSGRVNYCYAWVYRNATPADDKEEKELSDDFMTVLATQAMYYGNEVKDYVPRYANHAITFATEDMGSDKSMGGILLYILVAVLAFIFAITISNTISKEASVIGTLRASGYTKGELVVHYMTTPVLVTLVAAVIGNILGYTIFKTVVVNMYYNSYSLPTYETRWSTEGFLRTTLVPLVLMFFINLFVIVRKLKLSPLKFLRHDLKKSHRKKALRLPHWKFFTRFRTRILLQNVPNYVVLFIGIVFVMTMLALAVGMPATLKHYQNHFSEMLFVKNQLVLTDYEDKEHNLITTSEESAERFSMESLVYRTKKLDEQISIYGVEKDSRYVKLPAGLTGNEVYISTAFVGKYHFKEGDEITLEETLGEGSYTFRVKGVFDYDGGIALFMPNENFNSLFGREADAFNGYFSQKHITDIDENYIYTEITQEDLSKMARQLDHSMGAYMTYFQYLCILLSAALIYLLTKIIINKNENSISMVKILGYEPREIGSLYQMPTTIAVIISELLSIGIGYLVIYVFWIVFMKTLGGWFAFTMGVLDFVKMFVLVFIGYLIVMFIDFKRIRKIPMDQALKNVE